MPAAKPKVIYSPRTDDTLNSELNALVAVYRFILDCHAKKEGGPAMAAPDDAKGSKYVRAKENYTTSP